MDRALTALVIGNAGYPDGAKLKNPTNDAEDFAERIERCGFAVIKALECKNEKMDRSLDKFKDALRESDVGLFFFAGHGIQVDGENYLNAIDTNFTDETSTKYSSLALNKVIEIMEKSGVSTKIIILDACRSNPFERAWHRSTALRGLASIYAPKGTIIAFATSPGETASDGSGRNGAYTEALLRHIDTPDLSVEEMFKRVRNTLSAITKQRQTSWEHTSLSGEFFFAMSLGTRIDDYSRTALCDSLLVLDPKKSSHCLIAMLKVHDWYVQNPAMESFHVERAARYTVDSLFVIGRNVYQAACGDSNAAKAYIKEFIGRTGGLDADRRKALLDGMLFEIFFDSKGELRKKFKAEQFNNVFELQRFQELADSYDFISECLLPHGDRFYAIPGKKHSVAAHILSSSGKSDTPKIIAVHVGGANILSSEEDFFANDDGEPAHYRKLVLAEFEKQISEEMSVPLRLLKITYDFARDDTPEVRVPWGYTLRKTK
jgi:Caspase domain